MFNLGAESRASIGTDGREQGYVELRSHAFMLLACRICWIFIVPPSTSRPLKKVSEEILSSTSAMRAPTAFPQLNESVRKDDLFGHERGDRGLFQQPALMIAVKPLFTPNIPARPGARTM